MKITIDTFSFLFGFLWVEDTIATKKIIHLNRCFDLAR